MRMLSVSEAKSRIVDSLQPVSIETCAVNQAHARVLAHPACANLTQPPFPASAMDGYAIPASALGQKGVRLPLAGSLAAGSRPDDRYPPGHAIRVFTGSVVPDGLAAVVAQEDTDADDTHVTINITAAQNQHIRSKGQDFTLGEAKLQPGKRLTARDIGLLSAMNVTWVKTYRRPVIGLLATGDEILMPGEPMREAAIMGSSGPALAAAMASWGAEVRNLGVVPDRLDALKTAIEAAAGVDLLVTTGGVSVGTHDLIRALLVDGAAQADDQLNFWRIAMRPGKPLLWGRLGKLAILGLPGNPVSALVCGLLFLYPAIQVLRGTAVHPLPIRTARLTTPLPANGPRAHYLRASLSRQPDGSQLATPAQNQDSALMSVLSDADGLIVQQPDQPALSTGSEVDTILFADIDGF